MRYLLVLCGFALIAVHALAAEVLPGVEVLASERADSLAGKRVAILTNPTGVIRGGLVSTVDVVRKMPKVRVVRLFAPEHGVRGGFQAGENVDAQKIDPVSRLPVVSLHGQTRKPPAESLKDIDIVLYDIQDVGVRHYTFISTLAAMMEACEAAGVELWVLDRPDPLGGNKIGGPVLDPNLRSFIGAHTIPVTYGLTPGEFARLYKRERTPRLNLTVVPMRGWRRGMNYGDLGWPWVPPSEHIPRWETCFFYAMTGALGELQLVSEGVGTPLPFEQIGAPWIDSAGLAHELNSMRLEGVFFRPTVFRPRYGAYSGQFCNGVQIHLVDARRCNPAQVGEAIMAALVKLYPGQNLFSETDTETWKMFMNAMGDGDTVRLLNAGDIRGMHARIQSRLDNYMDRRKNVLLYP